MNEITTSDLRPPRNDKYNDVTSLPSNPPTLLPSKRSAFTLAEVLITLAIVGVVAALTLATLINNYQKTVTASKVKAFYTNINNAIRIATLDNGDPESWNYPINISGTYDENVAFVNNYISPYIKLADCKKVLIYSKFNPNPDQKLAAVGCILPDGGGVAIRYSDGFDIYYLTDYKEMYKSTASFNTRKCFAFTFAKIKSEGQDNTKRNEIIEDKDFVIPYVLNWDGTYQGLYKSGTKFSCSKAYTSAPYYCTKMLQMNNWKFPSNYPW